MHIEERDGGKWRATVRWEGERRHTTWLASKAAARNAGAELQAAMAKAALRKPVSGTVGELVDTWMRERRRAWSPTTVAENERLLRKLWSTDQRWRTLPVADVTPRWVRQWHRLLQDAGWSPHRLHKVHGVLSSVWTHAIEQERVETNPFKVARPPVAEREPFQAPTAQQVAALFVAAHDADPQFELYLRLAATTGARRSELIALRWRHLDFDAGEVTVRDSLVYAPNGDDTPHRRGRERATPTGTNMSERRTKTGARGVRVVPLDAALLTRLGEHRRSRDGFQGVDRFVFSNNDGVSSWLPGYVQRQFERVRRTADLPDIRLHQLRHFHATTLLTGAVPAPVIAARLGHSDAATTLRWYGHAARDASRLAVEQFAETLARAERGDRPDSTTLVYREIALGDEIRVLRADIDRWTHDRREAADDDDDAQVGELDELLADAQRQLDAKQVELREVRVLLDEARRLDDDM